DLMLHKYKLKEHGGAGMAKQYGLEKASGKYVTFLDADDEFLEESFLAQLLAPIIKKRDTEMVYSIVKRGDQDLPLTNTDCHGKLFLRKFLTDNQLTFPPIGTNEDNAFCTAAALCAKKVAVVKRAHYIYNYRNDSLVQQTPETVMTSSYAAAAIWSYSLIAARGLQDTKSAVQHFTMAWFYLFEMLNSCAYTGTRKEFNSLVEDIREYYTKVFHYYDGNKYMEQCYLSQIGHTVNILRTVPIQIGLNEFHRIIADQEDYAYADIVKIHKEVK
ncbi:MAG: glycosyltransferase, partial [Prevotella sp.]|nr:glycosyltransferase [Prevotella sp.]